MKSFRVLSGLLVQRVLVNNSAYSAESIRVGVQSRLGFYGVELKRALGAFLPMASAVQFFSNSAALSPASRATWG